MHRALSRGQQLTEAKGRRDRASGDEGDGGGPRMTGPTVSGRQGRRVTRSYVRFDHLQTPRFLRFPALGTVHRSGAAAIHP